MDHTLTSVKFAICEAFHMDNVFPVAVPAKTTLPAKLEPVT